jgi:hypothetical protein
MTGNASKKQNRKLDISTEMHKLILRAKTITLQGNPAHARDTPHFWDLKGPYLNGMLPRRFIAFGKVAKLLEQSV